MLTSIREKTSGIIAWTIIILVCITFAIWGISYYLTTGQSEQVVAKVDGIKITKKEYDKLYSNIEQQARMQLGANFAQTPQLIAAMKKQTMDELINSIVLAKGARSGGFYISNLQLDSTIRNLPAFQENDQFSEQRFQQVMYSMGYTLDKFLADMQNRMLIAQVQQIIAGTSVALPYEVHNAVSLISEKRNFAFTKINANQFTKKVNISDESANNYYQQHQKDFMAPHRVAISYIKLSTIDLAKNIKLTNKQLQDYYENNITAYRSSPKWHVAKILIQLAPNADEAKTKSAKEKIDMIYQKLKQGADFAELAKTYSTDVASKNKGGDLGWFGEDNVFGPSFTQTLEGLQKVGDYSKPIRTKYGFSIVKLLAMKPSVTIPFAKVKDDIAKTLTDSKVQKEFADMSDRLASLTYTNSDSLSPAAKALNLTIEKTGLFSQKGGTDGITKNPKVVAAAFSDDVLKQNYNSNTIQIDPNSIIVLRIIENKPAAVKPFAEVKADIVKVLQDKAIAKLTSEKGENLLQQLLTSNNKANIVQKAGLKWQVETNIGRVNDKIDPMIINKVFQLKMDDKNNLAGFSDDKGNYFIIDLQEIIPGSLDKNEVTAKAYRQEIERDNANLDYELYVRGLKDKSSIKIYQEVLNNNG